MKIDWSVERQAKLEANGPAMDAQVATLPELFQERIRRFRRTTPNWRRDFEAYEIFVCEQAVLFTNTFSTVDELRSFAKADNDEQQRLVPGLSDQHSDNTFGAALCLAAAALEVPERLSHVHGALCVLVSCQTYGCWAAYEGAVAEQ